MNLNQATICGRLTRDPELKALPSGTNVCEFSVATSSKYKKNDEWHEATEYHNITVYGNQADNCAKYLKKGSLALITGKLETRSWEKDGTKHYRTEIRAQVVQFGPRPEGSQDQPDTRPPSQKAAEKDYTTKRPEYPDEEISPDDIPF